MANKYSLRVIASSAAVLAGVSGIAAWILYAGPALPTASLTDLRTSNSHFQFASGDSARLIKVAAGQWAGENEDSRILAALGQQSSGMQPAPLSSPASRTTTWIDRTPVRILQDQYAGFSALAVDSLRDEIVADDEVHNNILVYDRLANTPPKATMTEPKRMLGGNKTKIAANCGVYVDPLSGDIYSLTNDFVDTMTVFSREAKGNVPPKRELRTPRSTFGVAVDEDNNEMFVTVQGGSAVLVYPKMAQKNEAPIRVLEGDNTRLANPHGIAIDVKNQWMFVSNRGDVRSVTQGEGFREAPIRTEGNVRTWASDLGDNSALGLPHSHFVAGSGRFTSPSITVYPLKASGDTSPSRIIQGSQTQLDWPAHISIDADHAELFVADAMADAILVFRATDNGNVAPIRVLKGPKTAILQPHGVFYDPKNQELVVANFGSHSVTVYARTAAGDTAPLRIIRSAPEGTPAPKLGGVGAMAYDSKRDDLLAYN